MRYHPGDAEYTSPEVFHRPLFVSRRQCREALSYAAAVRTRLPPHKGEGRSLPRSHRLGRSLLLRYRGGWTRDRTIGGRLADRNRCRRLRAGRACSSRCRGSAYWRRTARRHGSGSGIGLSRRRGRLCAGCGTGPRSPRFRHHDVDRWNRLGRRKIITRRDRHRRCSRRPVWCCARRIVPIRCKRRYMLVKGVIPQIGDHMGVVAKLH